MLFDADGNERREADGSLLSQKLSEVIQDGVTDVFFSSHGWKGDIPAAISQYDSWVGTMAAQTRDRELARARDPDFKAMAVCIHWPSLPWGVEDAGAALLGRRRRRRVRGRAGPEHRPAGRDVRRAHREHGRGQARARGHPGQRR